MLVKDSNGNAGYRSGDAQLKIILVDVNDETPTISLTNGNVLKPFLWNSSRFDSVNFIAVLHL